MRFGTFKWQDELFGGCGGVPDPFRYAKATLRLDERFRDQRTASSRHIYHLTSLVLMTASLAAICIASRWIPRIMPLKTI